MRSPDAHSFAQCRRYRRGARRAYGRGDAGERRRARHRLRPYAVGRPQVPDGRAGRVEPHAQRTIRPVHGALWRGGAVAARGHRPFFACRSAGLVRRSRTTDLRRDQRARLPESAQGVALVTGVVAASRSSGCAAGLAASLGRMDCRRRHAVRDRRRPDRCRHRCRGACIGRRELAAARLRRNMGRAIAGSRCGRLRVSAGQQRLSCRLVAGVSRSFRRHAGEGCGAGGRRADDARRDHGDAGRS